MSDPQKIILGTASCEDLLRCMMNIGDLELSILRRLLKKGPQRSEDLSRHLRRDRSIVHRGLQRLMACGLVVREKRNLDQGGYFYVYTSIPTSMIKRKMKDCIDNMYTNMKGLVDDLETLADGPKRR